MTTTLTGQRPDTQTSIKRRLADKRLTADDLLRLYSEGVRGELIRGELCETVSTGQDHGKYVANATILVGSFVKSHRLGSVMASDSGVQLERDPDTVREPDFAFISAEREPLGTSVPGYSQTIPDLVVEIKSPGDSRREVTDKLRMWLSYGVRVAWGIFPDTRTIEVHVAGGETAALTDADTLDGGDVIPGFTCAVSDIFEL